MNDEDSGEFRRLLVERLESDGFSWLLEQVEAQIAEGKANVKQVSVLDDVSVHSQDEFELQKPRKRKSQLVTTVPYSDSERLEILLTALKSALVDRANVEEAILEKLPDIETVTFLPDSASDPDARYRGREHSLSRPEVTHRFAFRERAERALSAVKDAD